MKTKDFERILESLGFVLIRSKKHKVWSNGSKTVCSTHNRHTHRLTAIHILKELGYKLD